MTKVCTKCGIEKDLTEFYSTKKLPQCKICIKAMRKQYYNSNKHTISKRAKQYRKIHKEEKKIVDKLYRENNKEKIKASKKKWYLTHKDHVNEVCRKYNKTPKHKKYIREYMFNRRNIDINFKLRNNLRSRIRMALKCNSKLTSSISLLGCTIPELKIYLEVKFQPGMSWENYGQWHIDHFYPCSLFDLTDYQEQKFCFHYTNLQPLWADDNMKKSDNIINSSEL